MTPQVLLVFMTRFEECKPMLGGITEYTRSHRPWDAFLDDQGRTEIDPQWLRRRRWQGVISRHTTLGLVRECAELGIPLVDLNDIPPFPGIPKIRPDNVGMGHLGGEHFLERGFTHYAFTGFRNNGWSCERRDGFVEAVRLAGHSVEVDDSDYPGDLDPTWDLVQTRHLARWLKKLPKPVCVMACNDLRALQVIHAAHTVKLPVPEEVAVLGCNNDEARCDLAYPPLSSVAANAHRSGYMAPELLDALMRGEKPGPVDLRVEPAGVVTRRSTDILAIADRNVAGAIAFIRERACSGIAVDDVLSHVALSRSQLEKRFRAYLGRSPQAEIRRVQVARIRQLLAETDFPLKKIADLAGFEHVEYMCVVFKRITGRAPGAYRLEHQAPEKAQAAPTSPPPRPVSRPDPSAPGAARGGRGR
jgi:LacI family transcriptional regulator